MTSIDVDFNARDEAGHVVRWSDAEEAALLWAGARVILYDAVEGLRAEALVAEIRDSGEVAFDVDWSSFVDGPVPEDSLCTADSIASESSSTGYNLSPGVCFTGTSLTAHKGILSRYKRYSEAHFSHLLPEVHWFFHSKSQEYVRWSFAHHQVALVSMSLRGYQLHVYASTEQVDDPSVGAELENMSAGESSYSTSAELVNQWELATK